MSTETASSTHYTSTAKWLHWLMGIVIIFDLLIAGTLEDMPVDEKTQTLIGHSSIGITLLVLALVRIMWRRRNPAPMLPSNVPVWQATLSRISHFTLYALMVVVPLTGIYIAQFSPVPVQPFGAFVLGGDGMTEAGFQSVRDLHAAMTGLLFILVCLHILAALYHRLIRKDNVLQRMAPRFRRKKD